MLNFENLPMGGVEVGVVHHNPREDRKRHPLLHDARGGFELLQQVPSSLVDVRICGAIELAYG